MKSCLLQFVIALTSNNFSFLCGLYEGDPVEQAIRKWKCGNSDLSNGGTPIQNKSARPFGLAFSSFAGAAGIGVEEQVLQINIGIGGFAHGFLSFQKTT